MSRNLGKAMRTQQQQQQQPSHTLPWEVVEIIIAHCLEMHNEWELWFGLGHTNAALRAKVEAWVLGPGRAATLPGRNNDGCQDRGWLMSRLDALFNDKPAEKTGALRYTAHIWVVPPVPPNAHGHERYSSGVTSVGVLMRLSDEGSRGFKGYGMLSGPLELTAQPVGRAGDGGGPDEGACKCLVKYESMTCSHPPWPEADGPATAAPRSDTRTERRGMLGWLVEAQRTSRRLLPHSAPAASATLLTEDCCHCDELRLKPASLIKADAVKAILAWEKRNQAEQELKARYPKQTRKWRVRGGYTRKHGTDYWQFYLYSSSHSESRSIDAHLEANWRRLDARHITFDDSNCDQPRLVAQFDWREIWVKNMANARTIAMDKELTSLERTHIMGHCMSILHGS